LWGIFDIAVVKKPAVCEYITTLPAGLGLIGSVLLTATYLESHPHALDVLNPVFDKLSGADEHLPSEQYRTRKPFFPEQLSATKPTTQQELDILAQQFGIMPPKSKPRKAKAPQPKPKSKPAQSRVKTRLRAPPRAKISNQPAMVAPSGVSAPFSVGFNIGPSVMPKHVGTPQMDTTVSSAATWQTQMGVRVAGSDYLNYTLAANPGTTSMYSVLTSGASTPIIGVGLTPLVVSSRLGTQEELYQYYAFREILFEILPGQAPNAAQGVNFLAFGVSQDVTAGNQLVNNNTLFQNITQLVPSVSWTAWEGAKLIYKYSGIRVFECTDQSTDDEDWTQAFICAGLRTSISGGAFMGIIRVTYIIDFYCPSFVLSSPSYALQCAVSRLARVYDSLPCEDKAPEGFQKFLASMQMCFKHKNSKTAKRLVLAMETFTAFAKLYSQADVKRSVSPPPDDPVEYVELVPPPGVSRDHFLGITSSSSSSSSSSTTRSVQTPSTTTLAAFPRK
jgi:hypothetical protein